MADMTLSEVLEWRQVRRVHRTARFSPRITIRRNGTLAISSDFVKVAGIADCTRASLFLSADGMRLGIRFHSDEVDDDAFILAADGGGGKRKGTANRIITAPSLLAQSAVISALVREETSVRRLEPRKDAYGRWVIDLIPCFERSTRQNDTRVGGTETGIYRYRLGADTVYIGRGHFAARFAAPERREWQFDIIEYSVLNDESAEKRWEAYWLNEYRQRHGRWPFYNRVAGTALPVLAEAG